MAALAWLLIPLFAAVGAAIWARWAARDRTSGDVSELAGYSRFREAMERSHAGIDDAPAAPVECAPAQHTAVGS
ncbi:hypothetical protein [Streptomyces sp. NBC_00083]|uniref:hypothetical protein n=1 Tax=Streptomyces sp. NBC_00083 TaxID=2975647 RepID=UPI00225871D9|nr:hypothetical protein [Streptomyces sp. NBC_00083]MCX5385537.1 hypothetical protein [Streptomyces sp. NBC_00083]